MDLFKLNSKSLSDTNYESQECSDPIFLKDFYILSQSKLTLKLNFFRKGAVTYNRPTEYIDFNVQRFHDQLYRHSSTNYCNATIKRLVSFEYLLFCPAHGHTMRPCIDTLRVRSINNHYFLPALL